MTNVNRALACCFAVSLALHGLFILLWPKPEAPPSPQEPISVAFVPPPPPPAPALRPAPRPAGPAPTRPSRSPAIIAKKDSPQVSRSAPPQVATAPRPQPERAAKPVEPQREAVQEPAPEPEPIAPRQKIEEGVSITERRLPTLKELLPPVTWAAPRSNTTQREGPVRLDTKDPQYITYFNSIKRDIELVWEYPEPALRYGLQGKLLLEFAILADGQLESARIIRSSGSSLLDHEALRAIKAAAPFSPIPSWIDKSRLAIIASFEYLDNRLDSRAHP